jgi:hypothetical protein
VPGFGKTGTARVPVTASSDRSRDADIYDRYAVGLYRQALLTLGDQVTALLRAVLRQVTTSPAAAEDGNQVSSPVAGEPCATGGSRAAASAGLLPPPE